MNIRIGTKVRYRTDQGNVLKLIVIKKVDNPLYDAYLCLEPNNVIAITNGIVPCLECFAEDLQLGWK